MWNGIDLRLLDDDTVGDAHAHFNRLRNTIMRLKRGNRSPDLGGIQTLDQLIVGNERNACYHLYRIMGRVVANFIDQPEWSGGKITTMMEVCLTDPMVYVTLGCHPHWAGDWNQECSRDLQQAIQKLGDVRAIGECGLDKTLTLVNRTRKVRFVSWEDQKECFKGQAEIARRLNLPLVIHLRDAEEIGLNFLKLHLPRDWKLHRHCFRGTKEQYDEWMAVFPNTWWSLTAWITGGGLNNDQKLMIRTIQSDRLLLETDSPYFNPRGLHPASQVSRPIHALLVARTLTEIRGGTLRDILSTTMRNLLDFYDPNA